MKIKEWKEIKKLKDDDDFSSNLKVGDIFLHGQYMLNQTDVKKEGDQISYFKVLNINEKNVEYVTVFDILEKEEG